MTQITSIKVGLIAMCIATVPLSLAQMPRTGTSGSNKTAATIGTAAGHSGLSGNFSSPVQTGTNFRSSMSTGPNTNGAAHIGMNAGAHTGISNPTGGIIGGPAGDPTRLIANPDLRTSVYPDVCSDIRVHPGIRTTQGIYPSLGGTGGVAARDTKSPGGAADDPTGWIADSGLRSSVYPDVCCDIRVRPCTHTTPEICPKLGGADGVAAQGAGSHWCADRGGADLIAPARSDSKRLRQTQWCRRNAHRNQSNFNRYNLSHIIIPPSHVVLCLSDVSFIT